jgi:hypothetical protein
MTDARCCEQKDWVGSSRSFWIAWGLPILALVGAVFATPPLTVVIWVAALGWMGAACLANAARCGRRHCYFTGPFYLLLAVVSLLHGLGIVWLGPHGWGWLGLTVGLGTVLLWWLPERVWGRFTDHGRSAA